MEDHAATNVSVNGMFHIEQSVLSLSAVSTTLLAFLLLSTVLQPHAVMPLLLGTWRPSLSVNVFYPLNTQHKTSTTCCTHTHPFNGPFSGTAQVSRYQNLDFTEARDSEWQWLGVCKSAPCSRQTTTPAHHHSAFYRPDALPAIQPTASKH